MEEITDEEFAYCIQSHFDYKEMGKRVNLWNNAYKEKLVKFDQFNDIVELSKYRKLENKYAK